jgi:hypothetical protein
MGPGQSERAGEDAVQKPQPKGDISRGLRRRPLPPDLGLATETPAEAEHAVLKFASLLDAELCVTQIILQALLFTVA